MKPVFFRVSILLALALSAGPMRATPEQARAGLRYDIPADHLEEPASIPDFWVSEVEAIDRFLREQVRRGHVETVGHTAGDRPIRAVSYGEPRRPRGTTTFSGSLGFHDVRAYLGSEYAKRVFLGLGGVHGGEFEGIVGVVNLIAVLETGSDLRGRAWPGIVAARDKLDRIVLIPVVNVDGRARIPLRMERYIGTNNRHHQFFNTGYWKNGTPIGWPTVKEFIPLDFSLMQFPGGYPNDAGVNIQHDDFLGNRQPETQALFDLAARERPDLIFNMHTGAPPKNYFMRMHRPTMEAVLAPAYDGLYRAVHTALARAGLQDTDDPEIEANPERVRAGPLNLDAALNFHCGALTALIESPSHSFAGLNRKGEVTPHTAGQLLDAQLVAFEAGLTYLAEHGGRSRWAP